MCIWNQYRIPDLTFIVLANAEIRVVNYAQTDTQPVFDLVD